MIEMSTRSKVGVAVTLALGIATLFSIHKDNKSNEECCDEDCCCESEEVVDPTVAI